MKTATSTAFVIASLIAAASASPALATTGLLCSYFKLPNTAPGFTRHIDVQSGIDGGIVTGLVANNLGPNGLPVVTALGKTRATGSGAIADFDATTSELLW